MTRFVLAAIILLGSINAGAIVWSGQEQPIVTALRGGLPTTPNKLTLAKGLANL